MTRLAGRKGLVLGVAGRDSLGFACARRLAGEGADVVATYRNKPGRDGLADELTAAGCGDAVELDVLDGVALDELVARLAREWGRLDFIVHTIMHVPEGVLSRPLTALRASELHEVLDAGVFSLIDVCGRTLDLLAASGSARIVTLTSESSRLATPGYHAAGICKGALESAMRYLAFELGPRGVTCNAVSAPAIATGGAIRAVGSAPIEQTRAYLERRAMNRRASAEADIASAVAWLAGPDVSAITGQIVTVDGGYSASYF